MAVVAAAATAADILAVGSGKPCQLQWRQPAPVTSVMCVGMCVGLYACSSMLAAVCSHPCPSLTGAMPY
jgi:hypothetical protein